MEAELRIRNRIRQAIGEQRVLLGMELMLGSDRIVEICGWSGFDYVHLDQEHAPFGFEAIEASVRAADAVGVDTLVRVARNDPKDISRILETGASGIVIPQVRGADDVQRALSAMYHEPRGSRGMCPVTRSSRYWDGDWDDYLARASAEAMLVPIIENREALANIEEICAIPEIHAISFGAGDLGQSLGVGARGLSEPVVREAFHKVIETAKKHDTVVQAMPFIGDDPLASVDGLLNDGVGMVLYDADALIFSRECRRAVSGITDLIERRAKHIG